MAEHGEGLKTEQLASKQKQSQPRSQLGVCLLCCCWPSLASSSRHLWPNVSKKRVKTWDGQCSSSEQEQRGKAASFLEKLLISGSGWNVLVLDGAEDPPVGHSLLSLWVWSALSTTFSHPFTDFLPTSTSSPLPSLLPTLLL